MEPMPALYFLSVRYISSKKPLLWAKKRQTSSNTISVRLNLPFTRSRYKSSVRSKIVVFCSTGSESSSLKSIAATGVLIFQLNPALQGYHRIPHGLLANLIYALIPIRLFSHHALSLSLNFLKFSSAWRTALSNPTLF